MIVQQEGCNYWNLKKKIYALIICRTISCTIDYE